VEFSKLIQFARLVSDSSTSERVFSLLAKTVVDDCRAFHALILGVGSDGDFTVLSSHGGCDIDLRFLDLREVCSIAELQSAVLKVCGDRGYGFRVFPLISETRLFGAMVVLYSDSNSPTVSQWALIEGLTELTAISSNKAHQHQKLQQAFDDLAASQDALIRSEKFRALGQMSAGIAHDLKNLLNPLLLYTDLIRDQAATNAEIRDCAERMERILNRGLETVERLRDFSRQSSEDTETVATDLDSMVHEATEVCKPRLARIELTLQLGCPPKATIRPSDCVTAIVNLILNAVDAVDGKGKITVRTGSSDHASFVEVTDDGPGMTPEIKNRILEPFFTTKGNTGTGLGLSIVYAFTQRHGGRLDIDSEPGKGARFRMWFPAATA
jgi:signal transduction histidine kinase